MSNSQFIDANSTHVDNEITTDICVVGGGAAGITLVRHLPKDKRIIMIESGSFDMDGDTQALYTGINKSLPYFDLLTCRLRYFGGTTNHWGGFCRPNDTIDYEGRASLGLPKWAVSEKELGPYIDAAAKELGLKYSFNDDTKLLSDHGISPSELIDDEVPDFKTKIIQITEKKRLGKIYRRELSEQKNLNVYLNLNLVHIQLDRNTGSKVEHLVCKTLSGKTITVKAKRFVLACHGIENARLLLNSNDVHKQGLGNKFDHVGRYFMEHVHIKASKLIPSNRFPVFYNREVLIKNNLNANISFTDDFTRRNDMLQYYCRFLPIYSDKQVVDSAKGIIAEINKPFSKSLFEDFKVVLNDMASVKGKLYYALGMRDKPKYYYLDQRIEQAPNRNSRVVLSDKKDAFGCPLADLDWNLNEHDYAAFRKGQDKIIKEISAMGAGRFIEEEITKQLVDERATGHYHHIGTTRMSESIQDGVVDSNCKVHGVSNLYIAGSSVFPTAGYSGPTMLIIALSMRLAEHLSAEGAM
ncbi:GMC oxidoreductase [Gayadomonas joobiniege]|uniref:GMC oxidoreductase n=1 Tax=Gayadomonas joobiniege TaxID=1234606 RepID=UPI0003778B37|nr:GMC oxidoreductase [Gayadomonas joobiniege]